MAQVSPPSSPCKPVPANVADPVPVSPVAACGSDPVPIVSVSAVEHTVELCPAPQAFKDDSELQAHARNLLHGLEIK